jgi:two-component system sensor kinase FixL
MRHAVVGTTLGLSVMQLGFIAFVVHSDYDGGTSVTELQFMMLALVATGLLLGMIVSENRVARNALNESEARVRAIVSTAPDSIITVGKQGLIVAANPAAARIFGCSASQLVGKRVYEVLPDFEQVTQSGDACELTGVRCDGTRFPAELSIGITENESPALRIAVTRDITRRKAMERQLGRAARLAAAGEMAAALAHELHQPLSAIRNYAHATRLLQGPASSSELPGKIEHEATRAAEIVQRLRDFFRDGSSSFEYISVRRLIDGALAPMHEEAAKNGIALTADVACGDAKLLVDRVQFEAVIHSLVNNAFDSIVGAGQRVRTVRVSAEIENDWAMVSVADSGPGINADIADRLFEPFATTKITGIGMGLAMSRAIVEAYDGKLWVEDGAGGGAVFRFTIPPASFEESADDAE